MKTTANALTSNPAPTDCTCAVLCQCYAGLPEGAELIAFLKRGVATIEAEVPSSDVREAAALRLRIKRTQLAVRQEELNAKFRAVFSS